MPVKAVCRVLLVLAAALAMASPARADRVATVELPESIPPALEADFPPLLDPQPVNGSWAVPDSRPLGINLAGYDLTQEQINAARSTGCQLVRLHIPMERFIAEANPDWAVLDQVVSRLERAGFEILPVLEADSAVPEFYQQFCGQVATRYGRSMRYYQLLDDINYKIGLESRAYADLVSAARTSIILADPDALIVSGSIRGVDLTYLDILKDQGAMRSLDILAFSLYPPYDGIETKNSSSRREHCLPYMEDAVAWAARAGKPVWVTSLGVSTCYNWVGVDQPEQASMYARAALFLGYMGVERVIFAAIQDTDPTYQDPARCCGLLDVSAQPKASFYVLRGLNRAVYGAYHVDPPFFVVGSVFDRPNVESMIISPDVSANPQGNEYEEFQLHGLATYGFWFYAPGPKEYRYIYWLGTQRQGQVLLSLSLLHIGLQPVDRYILLDDNPSVVNYQYAENALFLPYLPLSEVPGVVRFEVKEHGRSG